MSTKSCTLGLSFCCNVIPVEEYQAAFQRLHQWGYDGVELWPPAFERYSHAQLCDMLAEAGLRCPQVSPPLDVAGNRQQVEAGFRLGSTFVHHAAAIGAPLLRVQMGRVRAEHADEQVWKYGVEALRRLAKTAANEGVVLALETVRDSMAETSRHALRILDEVGQDNLRLNLQLPLRGEDIWESLQLCSKFAAHMHIHNWQVTPSPDVPGNVLMSQITYINAGVIDYRRFAQAAVDAGFTGYLSIEHGTHHGRHAWFDTALRDGRYLRRIINELIAAGRVNQPPEFARPNLKGKST